ncbi:MAG: beta-ketoacyl-ACP synthase 3 [Spirochaetaceae bacterium]|nr:MAG: beta-ketoacyl-ACP synthase 3 [Spirochaetaceae bacterium]
MEERSTESLIELYRIMTTAREMDLIEQDFTARGEAFFHVSGAGHEASATLAEFLTKDDYLHCHYRDKALMLARGMTPTMFFMSLFNKDGSHSRGRQMNAHMSAPDLNILSLVGPVGNSALQAAGIAASIQEREGNPIVLCSLGDGMTQQGEVLEAIAHAVRKTLPVLFLVQDNAFAISTRTRGNTFYEYPTGPADAFYGIPITRIDGRDPLGSRDQFQSVVSGMRSTDRGPRIVVFSVDRLHNHTNADDQRAYRSAEEIEAVGQSGDPLIRLTNELVTRGVEADSLTQMNRELREELQQTARIAQLSEEPAPVFTAKAPLPSRLMDADKEYTGDPDNTTRLTMIEAIREVLDYRLGNDTRVQLFGEDIEDPKGDVFGITKGLTRKYGSRIENSPLAEASVIGVSVGRALAGERPVAFLQFADFLPIAYNQIWAELGSMWWRTDGGWQAPVIVMITCGGYKPGLGPFHASSLESLATHTPGVDVMMPATAGDAAGMLNAAFESGRPTLFFYPKNCLNNRNATTSPDVSRQFVPVGRARFARRGDDLTFVAYGNTVEHCIKAATTLESHGVECDVIDLRWLSPWDEQTVIERTRITGRLIVVHEDNHSSGVGAEIIATVAENLEANAKLKRVTRADTFVPCNFANQLEVLPGYRKTLETAVSMLGGSVEWIPDASAEEGVHLVEAIGSSPSDESITVVEWRVREGDSIETGQIIADLEADKAAVELRSPVAGLVESLLAPEGNMVKVGEPILKVRTASTAEGGHIPIRQVTRELPGTPRIQGLDDLPRGHHPGDDSVIPVATARNEGSVQVGILGVKAFAGSRTVSNEEISEMCPTWSAADIAKRTGIESRQWLAEGETAVDLATKAAVDVLQESGLSIRDIDLIICATETPEQNTPAVSTLVQHRLTRGAEDHMPQAYDLNAACSGYLYGLQTAYDYLHARPDAHVLVLTAESLSRRVDTSDPNTAPVFGDASSATIVAASATDVPPGCKALLHRPACLAKGEDGSALRIPADIRGHIYMDGPTVFVEAINGMMRSLGDACTESGITPSDLDLVVPHQANQRIINAVRQKLRMPKEKMFSNIAHLGNTSSTTIPLCLQDIFSSQEYSGRAGLVAFGGGYTFAGAIIDLV